jgi:hypothetical protein
MATLNKNEQDWILHCDCGLKHRMYLEGGAVKLETEAAEKPLDVAPPPKKPFTLFGGA